MGLTFDVMSPDVDESVMRDEAPHAYVERLSRSKAAAGLAHGSNQVVIAADTIVTLDDAILGKPSGPDDGKQMLLALAGRAHSADWTDRRHSTGSKIASSGQQCLVSGNI